MDRYQYGRRRIANLTDDAPGFSRGGPLATTEWVPFDLEREDLLDCLRAYVQEERRGGFDYEFNLPGDQTNGSVNTHTAMELYERTGQSPLSKWQTHLFEYKKK